MEKRMRGGPAAGQESFGSSVGYLPSVLRNWSGGRLFLVLLFGRSF